MPGICPPLASWQDMITPGLDLSDVKEMHRVMDETIHQREVAANG